MKDLIRKHALKNALDHGKANPGAVLGRVLGEDASLRSKVSEIRKEIDKIVQELGAYSKEQLQAELEKLAPELLQKKEKKSKEKKFELPEAKQGKVVMRFAPSASGPLHIGHAYVLSLNSELARKYKGKLIIRIEDTNPDNIYPDAYKMIPEDAKWLTKDNVHEVFIQSERMGFYYDYAQELIGLGGAYICTCDPDKWKKLVNKKQACPCRDLDKKEQNTRFQKMFGEYAQGEAVMRIKTDIVHPNPAMRDWPAMRIKEHPHPRTGKEHRLWPLLNFAVAIDDHLMGVTHTLRAKDHMDNEKRQKYLLDYFGWKQPIGLYVGVINFTDMKLSTSEARQNIERGKYTGWDDVQLPFLRALKRRGYMPETFINYALEVGLTQNDKKVSKKEFFKNMNHLNKEVIDKEANRYFFVPNPKKIVVKGAPAQKVELELHPDDSKRGMRKFKTSETFYVDNEDYKKLKDAKIHRLMDCLNFSVAKCKASFDSLEYEKYKGKGGMIIHWLPETDNLDVQVLMDDGSVVTGLGEKSLKKLKVGDVVQLERFGFCRLDKKDDVLVFAYGHR